MIEYSRFNESTGRVNLIGEHTDYNDGFVFPMAIPLLTIIVGAKNNRSDRVCRIKSLEPSLSENSLVEFSLSEPLKPQVRPHNWANYIIGVVAKFDGSILFILFNSILVTLI